MNKHTKQQLAKLNQDQCTIYGVESVAEQFAVEPAQAQRIVGAIQQSDAFLRRINVITVDQMNGEVLLLGVDVMTAGRTNTDANDRTPKVVHNMAKNTYTCQFTEFDTRIKYAELDAWGHRPEFKYLVSSKTTRANALSFISVGWNGKSIAAETNITNNPLGEDVNKGWLQHLKENNADNFLNSTKVVINDETNIDVLVSQAISALGEVQQNDPSLVVILGSELLAYSKERLYTKNAETPSEKTKVELAQVIDTFGGKPAYQVPFFPKRGIMVTTFNNLSIYIHNSMRRQQVDNPKRSQLETYSSKSVDYVIEDYELVAYIDSDVIKFEGEDEG